MVTKLGSKDDYKVIDQLRYDLSSAMYDYIVNHKDSLINVLDTYINERLDNMTDEEMLLQLELYTGEKYEFSE